MCGMATWYGGTIIDDIVPGHTGKGADFRLAEMKHADYPGIYHMVEIEPEDWDLLPDVPPGRDSVNIDAATEEALEKAGYIIGRLQRVIFYAEGVKETNWSATAPVVGTDGVERRWVYLHYFKDGQPSINWLDPSFAGMRLVIGDALHSLADLGSGALRLDANGFLGVEKSAEGMPAWSEGHPLSEAANHLIASMVRKVGGFTFQELNLTIDDIRATGEAGADLSYDFVNRPAYHHALATGDTEFLRLTLRTSLELGVDPASLVHALQNHDELTYELVHWSQGHRDDLYPYHGGEITGGELADAVRRDLCRAPHRRGRPVQPGLHHQRHRLHHRHGDRRRRWASPTSTRSTTTHIDRIRAAHLLLAMFNALQPGRVRAVRLGPVRHAHAAARPRCPTLLDQRRHPLDPPGRARPDGRQPAGDHARRPGCRGARSLYGSLPEQLADETSFARQLQAILAVRKRYGIAVSRQVDVPDVSHRGMLVLVHQLAEPEQLQLTVLNFANEQIAGTVRSEHLLPGSAVTDMFNGTRSRWSTTCPASTSSSARTRACRCWCATAPRRLTRPRQCGERGPRQTAPTGTPQHRRTW